jgi:hypothetical protein
VQSAEQFSISQWPRMMAASSAGLAWMTVSDVIAQAVSEEPSLPPGQLAAAHDLDGPGGVRECQPGGHGGDLEGAALGSPMSPLPGLAGERAPATTAHNARPKITISRWRTPRRRRGSATLASTPSRPG